MESKKGINPCFQIKNHPMLQAMDMTSLKHKNSLRKMKKPL